ncbi:hypothetical protein BESB_038440 [Besnoitia besnoiti]|uniref:Organic solute transporter ostalpha protein n=1 Tax=Besnoitia besnoiti TaxID=94643 RepID=A0A2A9MMN8_BESBE|nr:hypothetical protein BESB_038440 [Besnoitia besnoiti]PFH37386.1 hypothetical protein BESB_038440 [Besnoitia besnoiti]
MFLEEPIYHQAALASVVFSVSLSLFVFFSHLAYAYHTDVRSGLLLLLCRLRKLFLPLLPSSSSVCRYLPQAREVSSAPPLQSPLYVCRIVLLVPVYAITSYLALTYATPSPSSRLLAPILAPDGVGAAASLLASPPTAVEAGLHQESPVGDDLASSLVAEDLPPSRRLSARADAAPPSVSWPRGALASSASSAEKKSNAFPPAARSGASASFAEEAGEIQGGEGLGARLGLDFEGVEEGTGGPLGFVLHAVRDLYEVYVLYSFIALVISVLGGEERAVEQLHLKGSLQHPWPFNQVFRPLDCNRRLLRRIKVGAAQFVFVKPVATLLSLLFRRRGFLYFAAVSNVSAGIAMYALVLFYLAVRQRLRAFRLLPKFLCIKAVVFFCFWQALCLRWLVALLFSALQSGAHEKVNFLEGLASNAAAAAIALRIADWALCIEMTPFAIAETCAFSVRDLKAVATSPPDFCRRAHGGLSCHASQASRSIASAGSPSHASFAGKAGRERAERSFFWEKFGRTAAAAGLSGRGDADEEESERQLLCTYTGAEFEPRARGGKPGGGGRARASGDDDEGASFLAREDDDMRGEEKEIFLDDIHCDGGRDESGYLHHVASQAKLKKPLKQFVKGVRDLLVADDILCDATDALFGRSQARREYLLEERKREAGADAETGDGVGAQAGDEHDRLLQNPEGAGPQALAADATPYQQSGALRSPAASASEEDTDGRESPVWSLRQPVADAETRQRFEPYAASTSSPFSPSSSAAVEAAGPRELLCGKNSCESEPPSPWRASSPTLDCHSIRLAPFSPSSLPPAASSSASPASFSACSPSSFSACAISPASVSSSAFRSPPRRSEGDFALRIVHLGVERDASPLEGRESRDGSLLF